MVGRADIVLVAPGSRGHVDPLVGLARQLVDRGHSVAVVADGAYKEMVPSQVEFRSFATPFSSVVGYEQFPKGPAGALTPGTLHSYRRLSKYMAGINAELPGLLAGARTIGLGELGGGGFYVAQARGIPSFGAHVAPTHHFISIPTDQSSPVRTAERLYTGGLSDLQRSLGLAPNSISDTFAEQQQTEWPIFFGFPEVVAGPIPIGATHLKMVGYWPAGLDVPPLPSAVEALLQQRDEAPIFATIGSMTVGDPEEVGSMYSVAASAVGRELILQRGVGRLSSASHVISVGDVSYSSLFPHVACVIHSAGAGTTGAAVMGGVPSLPLPLSSPDQQFWAARLRELRVSPPVEMDGYISDPAILVEGLRMVFDDQSLYDSAQKLAASVNDLSSAEPVAQWCERYL